MQQNYDIVFKPEENRFSVIGHTKAQPNIRATCPKKRPTISKLMYCYIYYQLIGWSRSSEKCIAPPPQPPLPNKQTKQKEQTNRQTRKKRYSQHENDQEHKLELFI